METETAISEFSNGGEAFVEQILVSEERKKMERSTIVRVRQGSEEESFEIEKL